jgi:COMM domain containing 10
LTNILKNKKSSIKREIFELQESQVTLLIDSCQYIFDQALYYSVDSTKLSAQLEDSGLTSNSETFKQVWEELGSSYVNSKKENSLQGPLELVDVNWRTQIKLSQASSGKLKTTNSVFEFVLGRNEIPEDKIVVEFTKEELYEFFTKIEKIQTQLDSLN